MFLADQHTVLASFETTNGQSFALRMWREDALKAYQGIGFALGLLEQPPQEEDGDEGDDDGDR